MAKMAGYFVWAVKGEYSRRSQPTDKFSIVEVASVPLECLVLTRDPLGRDVADLALKMRIGEPEHWDEYTPTLSEMRCLGWAQGADEDDHVSP